MRQLNVWRRLNAALMLLVLLLLMGVGLGFWVQSSRASSERKYSELQHCRDRVAYEVLVITESLRALAIEPKNEFEKRRGQLAEAELKRRTEVIQTKFGEFPGLLDAAGSVRQFVFGTAPGELGGLRDKVLELADKDTADALTYYHNCYAAVVRQRDQLLRDLSEQIESVNVQLSEQSRRVSIAGLAGLVFVLLGTLFIGRFQAAAVAEPLKRLIAALERMQRGDLTERLALSRNDEFGRVGGGLDHLADDLCALVGQVQRSGKDLNHSAVRIATTAQEQQSASKEIAATTTQIANTSKQISTTSADLVKTIKEVSQFAEHTAGVAGSGQAAIARMQTTMRHIIEASGAVTAKLAVLSEKTANINSVVTTITKVADQTNLLSLNAAIEAEKAGEYGLGFAVVAMEIRRLADQTAVATYDIEKMVKEMQSAVTAGVSGMDKFAEHVRRGVEEISEVSSQLARIIKEVQALTPRFQSVNDGVHAQAEKAQQISDTLRKLSEAVRQTVDSFRSSSAALEQLNGAAHGLHNSVERFRINVNGEPREDGKNPALGI